MNPAGNFVTGEWAKPASYVECPLVESLKVTSTPPTAVGVKLAIKLLFEGFVFGFKDTSGAPNHGLPLTVSYETVGTMSVIVAAVVDPATTEDTLKYAVTEVKVPACGSGWGVRVVGG